MGVKLLLVSSLLLADTLRIDLRPRAVFVGGSVRLTCKVTPHPDNRLLQMGFTVWRQSERQLEGDNAPITWEEMYHKVPCDPGDAFCRVTRSNGSIINQSTSIEVSGCGR